MKFPWPKPDLDPQSFNFRVYFSLCESTLWVFSRAGLVVLLIFFAYLFENQFKEIWKARNLSDINATENEKAVKEYNSYINLELSVTKTRNAFIDLLSSARVATNRGLPEDLERHKGRVQICKTNLETLRVKFDKREVLLIPEIEKLSTKFLENCEITISMQNDLFIRNIKIDFGRMDAQRQVLEKIADELLAKLKGAIKQHTTSLRQRS